jgi:hypothetical protein
VSNKAKLINHNGTVEEHQLPTFGSLFGGDDDTCRIPAAFTRSDGRSYIYLFTMDELTGQPVFEEKVG